MVAGPVPYGPPFVRDPGNGGAERLNARWTIFQKYR